MKYACWHCGKSVTSELPEDSVIRAILVCPECVERDQDYWNKKPCHTLDEAYKYGIGRERKPD